MELKDSFGQVVNVGDYVVFAVKSQYLGSLGIGLVRGITAKGSLQLLALNTYGKTITEYNQDRVEHHAKMVAGGHTGKWVDDLVGPAKPHKKTLGSATTCYKIPAYAVPVDLSQALSVGT